MIEQKVLGWDIEIATEITDIENINHAELDLSCVGAYGDGFYKRSFGVPCMTRKQAKQHVANLETMVSHGFLIVTVAGVQFDFRVLAEASGLYDRCADLALNHHCDLLLMSVGKFGWMTGLSSFAKGANVDDKLKNVYLNDGSILDGMSGSLAPQLWADGETSAVLAYLKQDCRSTYEVARVALERGYLGWHTKSGKAKSILLPNGRLPTAMETLMWHMDGVFPPPNTTWMTDPPSMKNICKWAILRM